MKNYSFMHKFSSLFFCSLALLMLAACKPEMEFVEGSFRIGKADEASLSGGNLSIAFPSSAGNASIDLEANRKWTASFVNDRASEWCFISAQSGKRGTATITVTVKENTDYDQRSASILFTCGDVERTIVVTQKQKDALLLTSSRQDVGRDGGIIKVTLQTNIPFTYSVSEQAASWITPESPTKGLSEASISFKVAANEDTEKREGAITISSSLGKETVKVYQEGGLPSIIVSGNPTEVSSAGGTFTVEIRSNVDVSIDIPESCGWIRELATKAMSTNTFVFEALENKEFSPREATITFRSTQFDIEETLTVIQDQKDVILCESGDKLSFDFQARTFTIKTRFNVEYTVQSSASWLKPVKTKAIQEKVETFTLDENTGEEARMAELTFTSEGHPDANITIQVTQSGRDPLLSVTVPGLYGLDGSNYVKGQDGWNQTSCRLDADGNVQFRLLNASQLSAVTLTGLSTSDEVGSVCSVIVTVLNKATVSRANDYQATLMDVKDGIYWLRVQPDTYFIVKL